MLRATFFYEMALPGDGTALRLCLDRIIPPRRERPVRFKMPLLQSQADAVAPGDVWLEP